MMALLEQFNHSVRPNVACSSGDQNFIYLYLGSVHNLLFNYYYYTSKWEAS